MKCHNNLKHPGAPEACRTTCLGAAVLITGLLAFTTTARADTNMRLDPFGEASAAGVDILDLDRVTVAIFGSGHLNVRDVEKATLRLGSRDMTGARPISFPQHLQDVNGDGYKDRLAEFYVSRTGLDASRHIEAVLTGSLQDGTAFVAYDSVLRNSEPVDFCSNLTNNEGIIGVQCTYSSTLEPLDLQTLISNINFELAESTNLIIDNSVAVVMEAWGGAGHKGDKEDCTYDNNAKPGDGGSRGYAQTVQTVQTLMDQLNTSTDLYLYVGEDGPKNQAGGSSSVAIGQELSTTNITSDADAKDPSGELVLAISGAGGGGGKGHCVGGTTAYGGYHGGAGAVSTATTTADASNAGDNGSNSHEGQGGNPKGGGDGGAATEGGGAGTDGIGGFGSEADATWKDSTLTSWSYGHGAKGGDSGGAGGGGGGFGGGGGGGGNSDHLGGGGGGGSWARQSTVDVSTLMFGSDLVIGSSYNPGMPQVVLTFQVIANSGP